MRGFSLVELSIVLVILGLLTGGILAGQSLIRASELRAMPTDVERYTAAINTFRDKYFAEPGDMPNAVRFWGAQTGATTDGVDATCEALGFASPSTTQATCNGNGDGRLVTWAETWRAWQHLANAGLVEGTYAGVPGDAVDTSFGTPGFNMPRSKTDARGGYAYHWSGDSGGYIGSADVMLFEGYYGNMFRFGAGNGVDEVAYLLGSEAWNIDTKMDDGRPGYGRMRAPENGSRPNCATTSTPNDAEYNLTTTTKQCNLFFLVSR